MKNFVSIASAFSFALLFALSTGTLKSESGHAHDHAHEHEHATGTPAHAPHLHFLEVVIRPQTDGTVEVEQNFRLEVDGVAIKRGPVMNYLSAFESAAGLILDTSMEVISVTRNDVQEPFRMSTNHGTTTLLVGSKDVFLESGVQDYTIRYRRLGSWKREGGNLVDTFDVTEAFRGMSIDRASAKLVLPEGATFQQRSAAVTGTVGAGPGFTSQLGEGVMTVETTAPLDPFHSFFLNTSWVDSGFSNWSVLTQIFLQHPRIPVAATGSLVLLLSLWVLIAGGARRERERRLAAGAA